MMNYIESSGSEPLAGTLIVCLVKLEESLLILLLFLLLPKRTRISSSSSFSRAAILHFCACGVEYSKIISFFSWSNFYFATANSFYLFLVKFSDNWFMEDPIDIIRSSILEILAFLAPEEDVVLSSVPMSSDKPFWLPDIKGRNSQLKFGCSAAW
jgi:hypothetical protein